jgi:hypothetical protein
MRALHNMRLAIILAVVVFLNASGYCALLNAGTAEKAHACCQKSKPQKEMAAASCCSSSGDVAKPKALVFKAPTEQSSTVSNQVIPLVPVSQAQISGSVSPVESAHVSLYLKLRRLLI